LDFELSNAVFYYAISATLMNIVAMALLLKCIEQIDTLFTVILRNAFPFILFHLASISIMGFFESTLLAYLLVGSMSVIWFLMIGGINQIKQLKSIN